MDLVQVDSSLSGNRQVLLVPFRSVNHMAASQGCLGKIIDFSLSPSYKNVFFLL